MIVTWYDDADAPAESPCDRCGADLTGQRYAMRPMMGTVVRNLADLRDVMQLGAWRDVGDAWCEPCAGELLARDGVLTPSRWRRLAADALGAREWAERYASDAHRTRIAADVPLGVALAAWRLELLGSVVAEWRRGRTIVTAMGDLPPVWWTEPLEPLDDAQLYARRRELAAAFGVELAAVEVRR